MPFCKPSRISTPIPVFPDIDCSKTPMTALYIALLLCIERLSSPVTCLSSQSNLLHYRSLIDCQQVFSLAIPKPPLSIPSIHHLTPYIFPVAVHYY